MSVRVAVIGCGIMGSDHARILAEELPGTELRVACDTLADRARKVAEDCGAQDFATDPMEVISRRDVDAVLIASLDESHPPLTMAAIAAGKPVLCEKPLAPGADECLEIVDTEIRSGRQLVSLGFMRRFDPSYSEMKAVLAEGKLGRIIMMHNLHRNVQAPGHFTGQMAITNSATHEFDVARFVLETEYSAVSAFQPKLGESENGAPVFVVLETVDGPLVTIEVNNDATYGYDVRGELIGRNGSVSLNAPVHSRLNLELMSLEHYPKDWRPRFRDAYRLQNKDWIRSVQSGRPSGTAANAWDGYCATAVAEAGVRALSSGKKIAIKPLGMPAFYREQRSSQ